LKERPDMKSSFVLRLVFLGVAGHSSMLMAQSSGTFTPTGNMITPRAGHTATLLPDGTVLSAGGSGVNPDPPMPIPPLSSAEIYDPSTGTFTATGSTAMPHCGHTATLLASGKVLIAGGDACSLAGGTVMAELYDPSTLTFAATGSMIEGAVAAKATLLLDGKVLIAGGALPPFYEAAAQLYDPAAGTFAATGGFVLGNNSDYNPFSATLLSDGKTLFLWGQTAQLYNPDAGTFSLTGGMLTEQESHMASLLINGKVLVAGGAVEIGGNDGASIQDVAVADAELYDPATGTFTATGKMTIPRVNHTATVLPDGEVLMAGGSWDISVGISADLYDPSTGTFTAAGNMIAPRVGHTATRLADGSVLIAGGFWRATASPSSAELYKPRVLQTAPVLFSLSGDGQGQGAIWHAATGQIASPSYPAIAGEVVSIYTTGLFAGGVIPPLVAIGGRPAEILFFGNAPGFPGFNQVNFRVPNGVEPGPAVSVRLTYLGRPSNEVTIGMR
jgi:hypothetical protein